MNKEANISLDDFLLLTVIGKGSYAKVLLVKKKDTGEVLALKVLKKDALKEKQVEHVKTERNVLIGVQHPFVIKLHYAFQNARKLFFALEYCPGGELFNLLTKKKFLTEDQARFYAVQILLAIEHIHSKDIIYRDLKPENVLIDSKGYVRITDFGLSKMSIKGSKDATSICGTPEYLAPEVIMKKGYGKAVDWWTFGSIIYEMLTGFPPFYSNTREELYDKIKFGTVYYPKGFTPSVKDLLNGFFVKDPDNRLGSGSEGAKAIKNHVWFSGVNWEAYLKQEIAPPFTPVIKGDFDVSNFDPEFTEIPVDSYKEGLGKSGTVTKSFKDFTWDEDNDYKKQLDTDERQV